MRTAPRTFSNGPHPLHRARLLAAAALLVFMGGCTDNPVEGVEPYMEAAPEPSAADHVSKIGTWFRTVDGQQLVLTVTTREGVFEVVGKGILVGTIDPETGYLHFGGCRNGEGVYDAVIKLDQLHLNAHAETQGCTRMEFIMGSWTQGTAGGAGKTGTTDEPLDFTAKG